MSVHNGDDLLRLATIGAAHGLRGDVKLTVHTDDPESRLAPGTELATDSAQVGTLRIERLASHGNGYLARFAGYPDRTAAESLRGVVLLAPPSDDESDAWYPAELTGLVAQDPAGRRLGTIAAVRHFPAQDVLVLRSDSGTESLVPFVAAIVTEVDLDAGRVVIDAPPGLLEEDR